LEGDLRIAVGNEADRVRSSLESHPSGLQAFLANCPLVPRHPIRHTKEESTQRRVRRDIRVPAPAATFAERETDEELLAIKVVDGCRRSDARALESRWENPSGVQQVEFGPRASLLFRPLLGQLFLLERVVGMAGFALSGC
jgi:hypothetical protein